MPKPTDIQSLIPVDDCTFDSLPQVAQDALITSAYATLQSNNALVQSNVRGVTELYNNMRSAPSISSLPSHSVTSASLYVRDSHVVMTHLRDNVVREDYKDMIKYISRALRCTDAVTAMPTYTVDTTLPHEVGFISRSNGAWKTYVMSTSTMYFNELVVVTDGVVSTLCAEVDKVVNTVKDKYGVCRAYQVVVTGSDGCVVYYNTTPAALADDLAKVAEEYEDTFCASSIAINFTHSATDDATVGIEAGNGEGIPWCTTVGGHKYWVVDLVASRKYCVVYARRIWETLVTGGDHAVDLTVMTRRKSMLRAWVNDIRSTGVLPDDSVYSVSAVQSVYPCSYRVVTSLDTLPSSVSATIDTCHYYYDCGHVAAVVADAALSQRVRQGLQYMAHKTVVTPLRPTRHIQCSPHSVIAVMDIECHIRSVRQPVMRIRSDTRPPLHGHYEHVPLLVGLLVDNKYTLYRGHDCIQQVLDSIRLHPWAKSMTIWIHNGGRYDVYAMFNDILCNCVQEGREPVKIADYNGALASVQFGMETSDGDTVQVTLKDSYRLLPQSLADLAAAYGLGAKVECAIVSATESQILDDVRYHAYVKQDCSLLQCVLGTYRSATMSQGYSDPLAFSTQASFTRHTFLERYYDITKPIYTMPKWLHEYVDRAYNGGRNEVYQRGVVRGPLHVYDFTSLYPYVGTFDLPCGVPRYDVVSTSHKGIQVTASNIKGMFGFVEVTISDTPRTILPYYGMHKDGSYLFDYVFNQRVVVTSVELSRMVELGYTMYMHSAVHYDKSPVLKAMFEALFAGKRHAASRAASLTAKLATVSAYGMFGFKKYDRRVLRVYHRDAMGHVVARGLSGSAVWSRHHSGMLVVNEKVHVHDAQCNVAIAAFITAYGRDMLYQLMCDIETRGGRVYYCDTDSVFTDYAVHMDTELSAKWMRSGNGTGLGELKCEYTDVTEAVILSQKVYAMNLYTGQYIIKMRGVDSVSQDECTYNELVQAMNEGTTHIDKTVRRILRHTSGITERRNPMRIPVTYNKGIVLDTGLVHPLSGRRK